MQETEQEVRLRPLVMREEGGSWIVGRTDSGDFVELPAQAVTFLTALTVNGSVAQAEAAVRREHGQEIDSEDFLTSLVSLGYIASVGDYVYPDEALPPSLPWIRPAFVRPLFSPAVAVVVAALLITGLVFAFSRDTFLPRYSSFFVTDWNGFNIAWNTLLFLVTVAGHEFCHLAAARAADVHARFSLGTRLNMLAAQTTVSGLWGASRRIRFRVYLAGLIFDLCVMAIASILLSTVDLSQFTARTLESLTLALFVSVLTQFALYMRTDIYFVCQELLRCKNLYADAWAYVRYVRKRRTAAGSAAADPVAMLPERERTAVKAYAWFMILGSGVSLAVFAGYGAPILLTLFARSFVDVYDGATQGELLLFLNGAVVLLVEGTLQVLFLKVFFRKHGQTILATARAGCGRLRSPWASL